MYVALILLGVLCWFSMTKVGEALGCIGEIIIGIAVLIVLVGLLF